MSPGLFPGMFAQMVQITKLWSKDKSTTWGQGYGAAWATEQMTEVLLLMTVFLV